MHIYARKSIEIRLNTLRVIVVQDGGDNVYIALSETASVGTDRGDATLLAVECFQMTSNHLTDRRNECVVLVVLLHFVCSCLDGNSHISTVGRNRGQGHLVLPVAVKQNQQLSEYNLATASKRARTI